MHIVLLILKILGIILLVLFGLLLLVLCTVLFVPVRYQISGSWKEEKWGRVRVSWLLSAICVNGSYEKEKGLQASLRVLWLKLWSMGEEEQTEPPKESKTEAAAKSRDKAETAKETKAEKSKTEQQKTEQSTATGKQAQQDYYTVQRGDTLDKISLKLYGTANHVEAICKMNGLTDGNLIYIGQKLLLP